MTSPRMLRVLIADDESLVIDLIEAELELAGFAVAGRAHDGRQVVTLTRELRPDVVLMDIAMPEQDGISAAAVIQEQCPTPVVILSAHEGAVDLQLAAEAGVGAYMVKPPRASELERAITIACARHADLVRLRQLNAELKQALADVRTLTGMLPVCCSCKKVRDGDGDWNQMEVHLKRHTNAEVTHTYCPECLTKYFPELELPAQ